MQNAGKARKILFYHAAISATSRPGYGYAVGICFDTKEQTLEKYIEQRAETLARAIVLHTAHNMNLENQQVAEEQLEYAIEERKNNLSKKCRKCYGIKLVIQLRTNSLGA